jgi:ligand-binding SRPBCC domain-containing protein
MKFAMPYSSTHSYRSGVDAATSPGPGVTEIESWNPPTEFIDVQARGPYRFWHHTHSFQSVPGGTLMRDSVRYALPFGLLGRYAHARLVKSDLMAIFDYRAWKVSNILGSWCDNG